PPLHSPTLRLSSLMTPPTPTSTPFPSTTLFRSLCDPPAAARALPVGDQAEPDTGPRGCGGGPVAGVARQGAPAAGRGLRHAGSGDRKSTRLNSSHVKISYAVVCLRKKKKTRGRI